MPAQCRRATGKNGPPDLGCAPRQRLAGEIARTESGEHLGQAGRIHEVLSWACQQLQRRSRAGQMGLRQMESSAWSY